MVASGLSETIALTLAGEPLAAGRPRFTRGGIAYTPPRTRSELAVLRLAAQSEMAGRPPFTGPLEVTYIAHRRVPMSWSKKLQGQALLGIVQPIARPDADNLLKMLDALTHVVWKDDAQIVRLNFEKRFSDRPRVEITVRPWQPPGLLFSAGEDDD